MCRLLPGEKPRQRKDFGTTSYKKPGPPTPSKNGGRLSLQGNEVQPLGEHNDKTPKKVTPSRIKALFMGRSSSKENSEVYCPSCELEDNFIPNVSDALSLSLASSSVPPENFPSFKTLAYNKLSSHCKSFSFLCICIVRYYLFLPLL